MQIKKLENFLGVCLLERTNKTVLLTDIGKTIVERAKIILNQLDEIQELAKLAKDPYQGELKIGIIPTLAPYFLPHIIPHLSKHFPSVSLFLIEEKTTQLIEKLTSGKLDAAFLAPPILDTTLVKIPLFDEEFLLAVPANHVLTKHKTIKQRDLKGQELLLLEEGHCMHEQTLALCQKMQISTSSNFRATSLETLRHMVAAKNGITLIPKLAAQKNRHLAFITMTPKPCRTIALYWRHSTTKSILLNEIATKIKELIINITAITPA